MPASLFLTLPSLVLPGRRAPSQAWPDATPAAEEDASRRAASTGKLRCSAIECNYPYNLLVLDLIRLDGRGGSGSIRGGWR
jgi:hypothetical protein